MSMTDEGKKPSGESPASETRKDAPFGRNSPGQPAQGLPGLAGFGQMQGYVPVTGQQDQAGPEQDPGAEQGYHQDPRYAGDGFEAGYTHGYPEETQDYGHGGAGYAGAGVEDSEPLPSYPESDAYGYTDQQYDPHQPHDDALYGADAGGYEKGEPFPSDFLPEQSYHAYHGDNHALQTFEAKYDQHPEIPIGAFESPGEAGEQPFFHEPGQGGDADFMSGGDAPEVAAPRERRGRKILMASSGLIGVMALGGALAFAYKIGGDSNIASTGGGPPLIQADNQPVKMAPDEPGGKEFPHKNKKIYERLQGESKEETVQLESRQEDVAAAATAAVNDPAQASREPPPGSAQASPGAPRKVKTLTVRPDGTIEESGANEKVVKAPAASAPATNASPDGTIAMTFPQDSGNSGNSGNSENGNPQQQAAEQQAPVTPSMPEPAVVTAPDSQDAASRQASAAPQQPAPPPAQKPAVPSSAQTPPPAPQQTAPAAPALPPSAPAASPGDYVVQVAARKSQTDALAAFADIQQKYPRLLDGYRPIIKKADLGDKGVWYRLNVGPVESKQVASSLCGQLKSAGMPDCIVRTQ